MEWEIKMRTFKQATETLYTKAAEKLALLPGVNDRDAEILGRLLAESFPCPPLRPPWVEKSQYMMELNRMNYARGELRNLAKEKLGIVLP
jgi:hypothetical protein